MNGSKDRLPIINERKTTKPIFTMIICNITELSLSSESLNNGIIIFAPKPKDIRDDAT